MKPIPTIITPELAKPAYDLLYAANNTGLGKLVPGLRVSAVLQAMRDTYPGDTAPRIPTPMMVAAAWNLIQPIQMGSRRLSPGPSCGEAWEAMWDALAA